MNIMQRSKQEEITNWSNSESYELISMIERYYNEKYPPGQMHSKQELEGSRYDIPGDWRKVAAKCNHSGEYTRPCFWTIRRPPFIEYMYYMGIRKDGKQKPNLIPSIGAICVAIHRRFASSSSVLCMLLF